MNSLKVRLLATLIIMLTAGALSINMLVVGAQGTMCVDASVTFDKPYYDIGEVARIYINDPDANRNPSVVDVVTVRVYSDSDPVGVSISAVESGINSGRFEASLLLSNKPGPGSLFVSRGDGVYVEYLDTCSASGKSKVFLSKAYIAGLPIKWGFFIGIESVKFVDPVTGAEVVPKVGKMLGISVKLSNLGSEGREFTAILVVKDPNGVTVKVDSISIPLAAGKSGTARFSFTPKLAGKYNVRVYVVSSLSNLVPLFPGCVATEMSVAG